MDGIIYVYTLDGDTFMFKDRYSNTEKEKIREIAKTIHYDFMTDSMALNEKKYFVEKVYEKLGIKLDEVKISYVINLK